MSELLANPVAESLLCRIRIAFSFSLVFDVFIRCESLIEPMKELVTGSAEVAQSEGRSLFGLSEIIDN